MKSVINFAMRGSLLCGGVERPLVILGIALLGAAGAAALAPSPEPQKSEIPQRTLAANEPHQPAAMAGPPCEISNGWYGTPVAFEARCAYFGLVQPVSWGFTPHDIPASTSVTLNDPLNANTHGSNANDPWTTNTNQNLWPAALNNIQFTSNTTPNGAVTPRGINGLTFSSSVVAGSVTALGPTVAADSLVIQCGTPNGRKVQAMALELVGAGTFSVWWHYENANNTSDAFIITGSVSVPAGQKVFVGFIQSKITRVEIRNTSGGGAGGNEYIASIKLYRSKIADCGDSDGTVGVPDLLAVINQWGQVGTPCDLDGNGIGVPDLLAVINRWGPVTEYQCFGENPSGGSCSDDGPCFPGSCQFTGCTPGTCFCEVTGYWLCTDDCCGHCIGIGLSP